MRILSSTNVSSDFVGHKVRARRSAYLTLLWDVSSSLSRRLPIPIATVGVLEVLLLCCSSTFNPSDEGGGVLLARGVLSVILAEEVIAVHLAEEVLVVLLRSNHLPFVHQSPIFHLYSPLASSSPLPVQVVYVASLSVSSTPEASQWSHRPRRAYR